MKLRNAIDIGSLVEYRDPLTNHKYKGTVIRIEPWCSPERIYLSSVKNEDCERYLVFWLANSPQNLERSWVCDQDNLNLAQAKL